MIQSVRTSRTALRHIPIRHTDARRYLLCYFRYPTQQKETPASAGVTGVGVTIKDMENPSSLGYTKPCKAAGSIC